MSDAYPITGIPRETGPLPLRKEIGQWVKDDGFGGLQLSLFIQAMTVFQGLDPHPEDPKLGKLSYFQIAGIHGFPSTPWDGAPDPHTDEQHRKGYCVHGEINFPNWHRPYMLLFEQRLWEIMNNVIEEMHLPAVEKAFWTAAANHWRLPYWNWGIKQPWLKDYGLPEIFTLEQVAIVGKVDPVSNPLTKFSNPSGVPFGDPSMKTLQIKDHSRKPPAYPWSKCVATSRWGITSADLEKPIIPGINNWQLANNELQHPRFDDPEGDMITVADHVFRLLTYHFNSYGSFASTKYHDKGLLGEEFNSLEYVHNNIHGFTGGWDLLQGAGHMRDVPVAAFDPIFYSHHSYIDQILALWQMLNWDKWFNRLNTDDATASSPLQPFHFSTNVNDVYDSNRGRCWTDLNYDYDYFQLPSKPADGACGGAEGQYRTDLIAKINLDYGKTRKRILETKRTRPDFEGVDHDYIINIIYDRYALNGRPYSIHFFIGDTPDDLNISHYMPHQTHVGVVHTFSMDIGEGETQCSNCTNQKDAGVLSKAQVPITIPLLRLALDDGVDQINHLGSREVTPYLIQKLHWRTVTGTGEPLPTEDLPALRVFVMKGVGEHDEDPKVMSRFHSYKPIWQITQDKVGGAGSGDVSLADGVEEEAVEM